MSTDAYKDSVRSTTVYLKIYLALFDFVDCDSVETLYMYGYFSFSSHKSQIRLKKKVTTYVTIITMFCYIQYISYL